MAFPRVDGYVVTQKIGSGSYSNVYKAHTKVGARQTVAIKCVEKSRVKQSGTALDNLVSEIRLLKSLEHPHIVKMINFTWDHKNIYIIMEYCSRGDLSHYIKKYGRLPEHQVRFFLQQLASALKFLYEKGIIHMDLKPHNLLLHQGSDRKLTLKLADFGFAQHLDGLGGGVRGSPLYMAPEVAAGAGGGAPADMWSVGVILYECLFGAAPYASATLNELIDKIHRQDEIKLPPNSSISPACEDLLRSLLQHSPALRLTQEQFFSHEYLDLEHMPSEESYDKAVSLIHTAVALDTQGSLAHALQAYTAALQYLVPYTARAPHPALTRALHGYMERAEAIKAYLATGVVPEGMGSNGANVGSSGNMGTSGNNTGSSGKNKGSDVSNVGSSGNNGGLSGNGPGPGGGEVGSLGSPGKDVNKKEESGGTPKSRAGGMFRLLRGRVPSPPPADLGEAKVRDRSPKDNDEVCRIS